MKLGRGKISVMCRIGGKCLNVSKEMTILVTVKLVKCLNISKEMTTPQIVVKLVECCNKIVV